MPPAGSRATATFLGILGLAGALLVAFAARSIGFEQVFLGDGTVVFNFADSWYHARLALYSYVHFPDVLTFDPCLSFPDGAPTVFPPLWDWTMAAAGHAFGGGVAGFERVAAWLPVVFGALTTIPVFVLGRAVGGRGVGVGAAFLYALLPVTIAYTQVGNVDHHALAGFLGAVLLAGYVTTLAPASGARAPWLGLALLAVARAALLLTWNGGLLYIVPGELALAIAAAHRGGRPLLAALAAAALGSAALLALAVWALPTPVGGPYSATELSRLQPLAFLAEALVCGALAFVERRRPAASPAARLGRLAALAVAAGLLLLAVPGVFAALRSVFEFLTKSGSYTAQNLEQLPLFFGEGAISRAAGERRLGYLAYLVPLVPLAFLPRAEDRGRSAGLLLLFGWSVVLAYLTLQQVRFGHDFAPAASVGFALLLARAGRWLAGRWGPRAAGAAAVALGALALWPTVPAHFAPALWLTRAALRGELGDLDRGLLSIGGTQTRFAQTVAAVTPPSPGCGPDDGVPGYGILAHPAMGHSLLYTAHRAAPAGPFGPFSGKDNWDAVNRFLQTDSEDEALAIARRLRTPYVLTAEDGGERPAAISQRLQREHGSAQDDRPQLGHFRLLAEGPAGGIPIAWFFEDVRRQAVPYRLFEIVPGALLEVPARPGEAVIAELPVATSIGRRFVFRARGVGEADGVARLRVPYATDGTGPTHALGGYRIAGRGAVQVSERAVREGATVPVARDGAARRAAGTAGAAVASPAPSAP